MTELKHRCIVKNELDQTMDVENSLWIYDSQNEFLGDFKANYCPFCGLNLNEPIKESKCKH